MRGETIRDQEPKSPPKDRETSPRKEVSEAKIKMQSRLPALDDDSDAGIQKEQIVIRDGKADLAFTGKLLASAAPPSAPKGHWQEYRIYETSGGQHVFSKMTRSVFAEEQDTHEAEVFDPSPSSVPSQLLRSARDLARSRPLTWMDAAAAFFGYDPPCQGSLSKARWSIRGAHKLGNVDPHARPPQPCLGASFQSPAPERPWFASVFSAASSQPPPSAL